jgi:hypothetical protein
VEDLEHMMRCPALSEEMEAMRSQSTAVLRNYGIETKMLTPKFERLRVNWLIRAGSELAEPFKPQ